MHYVKLWSTLYDGTMADPSHWEAMAIWPHVLLLADPSGVLEMTHGAISRRTGIPEEVVRAGIAYLESEDQNSGTPSEAGRRIIRLHDHRDWGWEIVNFTPYRKMQSKDRERELAAERQRRKRDRDRHAPTVTVTPGALPSRQVVGSRHKAGRTETKERPSPSSSCGDESTPSPSTVSGDLASLGPRPAVSGEVVVLIPCRKRAKSVETVEQPVTERAVRELEREYPEKDVRAELVEMRRWALAQAAMPRCGLLWTSVMAGVHRWLRRPPRGTAGARASPVANHRAAVDEAYRKANSATDAPAPPMQGELEPADPFAELLESRR